MTYRLSDWLCGCGHVQEHLAWAKLGRSIPQTIIEHCIVCNTNTLKVRQLSLPARYTGEDSYAPAFNGGRFDTGGYESHPRPSDLDLLPYRDLTNKQNLERSQDLVQSPKYKQWKRERSEVVKRNAEKRKRAKAIASGANINLRKKENQLPGDPVKKLRMGAT